MTQTGEHLNYARFFANFQRFERGELDWDQVEQLSTDGQGAHVGLMDVLRRLVRRLRFPTPGEYYRGK